MTSAIHHPDSNRTHVLVVDDQYAQLPALRREFLSRIGFDETNAASSVCFHFEGGVSETGGKRNYSVTRILDTVVAGPPNTKNGAQSWALVLLDVRFDVGLEGRTTREHEELGFAALMALRNKFGLDLPVVMLTSEGEAKRSRSGELRADGFLPKNELSHQSFMEKLLWCGLLPDSRSDEELKRRNANRLFGCSLPLLKLLRQARRFALAPSGIQIIHGETGTGKSELAAYIHAFSKRSEGVCRHWFADPMMPSAIKYQLFGYWPGAYTGAQPTASGEIERANGGTFFLDELSNLPVEAQQMLLSIRGTNAEGRRRLQRVGHFPESNPELRRIATQSLVPGVTLTPEHELLVDVLLIAGTKDNLEDAEVRQRLEFQSDLHNAMETPIYFPSLNDRREDVAQLFHHLVRRFLKEAGQSERAFSVKEDVLDLLRRRDWSQRGNVRDMERIARHVARQLRDFPEVYLHNLPPDVLEEKSPDTRVSGQALPSTGGKLSRLELEHYRRRLELLEEAFRETWKRDPATGKPERAQPTEAIVRMLGHEVASDTPRRLLKQLLDAVFAQPAYVKPAFERHGLGELESWARSRPLLLSLYAYATGKIGVEEIAGVL